MSFTKTIKVGLVGLGIMFGATIAGAEEFNPALSEQEVADLQALFDCMDDGAKSEDDSIGCLQPVIAIIGPESSADYEDVAIVVQQ